MKLLYTCILILVFAGLSSCSSSRYYQGNSDEYYNSDYSSQQQITYQQFYNDLSPYGNWMYYPTYGYVWIPGVPGFRPYYTNGHWVYTNYGWTWVSGYNWGWAPFHYGRWDYVGPYGWMWIPGYEWAPAWVSWRGGGDYYGWAPMGPGMHVGVSVSSLPYDYWTFVPRKYISSPRVTNYYVNRSNNVTIINNTTIINNNTAIRQTTGRPQVQYNSGPPVREVERSTGTRIRAYNVVESGKPAATQINNNTVRVYRPVVNQPSSNTESVRPQRVVPSDQLRENGNQPSAPVRQFPADQVPQPNRNEPRVTNPPGVSPNRVTPPSRMDENVRPQQSQPAPVTRNPQPQNNPAPNNPPRREFRENNPAPANRSEQRIVPQEPVRKDQSQVPQTNNPAPVRRFNNPSSNVQRNEMRSTRTEERRVETRQPVERSSRQIQTQSQQSAPVREFREKKDQ